MHYFQYNIGDYAIATRHLSNMEDLAYRRMMEFCYDKEKGLPKDIKKIARLTRLTGEEESIEAVIEEVFTVDGDLFVQSRIQKEIEKYHEKADTARLNGKKSGRPPKKQAKPRAPKEQKEPFSFDGWNSKPSDHVLSEWVKHRTKKKATTSQLVISRMAKEINESFSVGYTADDCMSEAISRGWTGFKAEWIKNSQAKPTALHNFQDQDYSQYEGKL